MVPTQLQGGVDRRGVAAEKERRRGAIDTRGELGGDGRAGGVSDRRAGNGEALPRDARPTIQRRTAAAMAESRTQ
jgi:hypothetical protein